MASTRRPSMSRGLLRYLAAAVLARCADSGAVVGFVMLAVDPDRHVAHGAATGGGLAAALSAPHLVGPWVANRLDRARDGRRLLAAAYALYGVMLACAALSVGHLPIACAMVGAAVAGCCGPLLTGGLSSRLAGIAGLEERAQRRAQGWDAVTYGIGGTIGPALVAGMAALYGPLPALLVLCAAVLLAAGLTLALPPDTVARAEGPERPVTMRAGLVVLVSRAPLRRVTVMTMLNALELGALPVIAATLGPRLTHQPTAGAMLITVYGLGNLAGSLLVTAFPLRGEPETLALRLFTVLAAATLFLALAPNYACALSAFLVVGVVNSASFTSTLAARSAYAPAGARAQVFVSSAGLKIALSSLGAVVAGGAAGLGGRTLLVLAAGTTFTGVLVAVADRAVSPPRSERRSASAAPPPPGGAGQPHEYRSVGNTRAQSPDGP